MRRVSDLDESTDQSIARTSGGGHPHFCSNSSKMAVGAVNLHDDVFLPP